MMSFIIIILLYQYHALGIETKNNLRQKIDGLLCYGWQIGI
jgi:hypothetical protein